MQPPQHLHHTRSRCSRLSHYTLRHQWLLARYTFESAASIVERKEVRLLLALSYKTAYTNKKQDIREPAPPRRY